MYPITSSIFVFLKVTMLNYVLCCFLFLIFQVVFTSCRKENLKSPPASFLVANQLQLTTTPSQKSASHKITDLWLYVNGQFQGVYPVGHVMPIVAKESADILMYAGIKNNGISATRIPYPFYKGLSFTKALVAGETYSITPAFSYISGLYFLADENFDATTGTQFVSTGDSAYTLITDPTKTYGGNGKSVFMSMNDTKPTSEIRMSTPTYLRAGGTTIYMEIDYRCNQEITVGVIGGASDIRDLVILTPTTEWNKVYIQLTPKVSTPPFYSYYNVYIKALKKVSVPEIYIDNIKLITQ